MRRSRRVATLVAGGALVGATLTGCDPAQEEVRIYPTAESCAVERTPAECDAAFQQAEREHLATAPRFRTNEECEAAMGEGACTVVQNNTGTGFFMPLMMGYMLGRTLGAPRPIYVDRDGFARSPGGVLGRIPGGRTTLARGPIGADVPRAAATGTSRGGFGSTGRSFASGGG